MRYQYHCACTKVISCSGTASYKCKIPLDLYCKINYSHKKSSVSDPSGFGCAAQDRNGVQNYLFAKCTFSQGGVLYW